MSFTIYDNTLLNQVVPTNRIADSGPFSVHIKPCFAILPIAQSFKTNLPIISSSSINHSV